MPQAMGSQCGARAEKKKKNHRMHLNKIFVSVFPKRCRQLFDFVLPFWVTV